jgi:hypothetical protein
MTANERDMARKHGLALRDPARPELGWRRTTTFAMPSITGWPSQRTRITRPAARLSRGCTPTKKPEAIS